MRRVMPLITLFLIVEFLDEVVFSVREAAWPIVRTDLNLTYAQIGILLSIPTIAGNLIEPILGILGDVWKRRLLVLGGGIGVCIASLMTGFSGGFLALLIAQIVFSPSSGAFVSLSQATLMDTDPSRHEQNMARWTFAGSVGMLTGSLLISVFLNTSGAWRWAYIVWAGVAFVVLMILWQTPFPNARPESDGAPLTFKHGLLNAWKNLRRLEVIRWLVLLELSNLMLDILLGYLALYFVDVVGVSEGEAAFAIGIWIGVGLIGDFLLIPLLERVRGLDYLRVSAVVELILFVVFLLVPSAPLKIACLAIIGVFNAGWYAILQANLYSTMPNQSGTVLTLNNIAGLVGGFIPLVIGLVAEHAGLANAMWLFVFGPVGLLIGLPRKRNLIEPKIEDL
ncbi:MAG: MFS transporter [Anaerolineae bacterium]|nr:MFS transporter [Anaerolineae bacterium]